MSWIKHLVSLICESAEQLISLNLLHLSIIVGAGKPRFFCVLVPCGAWPSAGVCLGCSFPILARRLAKQRLMKISKVEAFLVSCPLTEPLVLPFYGGVRTVVKRDAMYIRVTADNGLCGFAPGAANERAEHEILEIISLFLEGRDPSAWPSFDFQGGLGTDQDVSRG